MNYDFKFNTKFVIITLVASLLVVPFLFNLLFMWESGLSRGEPSDWFTLYGNIFGGLTGGFFTYLALLLTFKEQKETKQEDMRPRIDIPHQTVEFIDTDDVRDFRQVVIELNNIGGSIAKNIECTLSLTNYDEVITALDNAKTKLKINFLRATTVHVDDLASIEEQGKKNIHMIVLNEEGGQKASLGSVHNKYSAEFVGTCIPLSLNHEAKTHYLLQYSVSRWINYVAQNRQYSGVELNKNELFNFDLEVKYSSEEYGNFTDTFSFVWEFVGIWGEDSLIKFKYVLKNTKVK